MDEFSLIENLKKNGALTIAKCEKIPANYQKMELDTAGQMQINALVQQLPNALAAGQLANAYTLKFPNGLPHTLMVLKQGGYSSTIVGNGNKILGTASLIPLSAQAAILGVFTAMSIVTSQYFLAQINGELKRINAKLDDILKFLYGDKKAELISELEFVKYATDNYNTIMPHDYQRIATLTNIQNSKKTARKDVDFYIEDLQNAVNMKEHERIIQIIYNISLSVQLYEMASLLEVHYAQNYEIKYLKDNEKQLKEYINKCEKRMLTILGGMKKVIEDGKAKITKKDKELFEKEVLNVISALEESKYFEVSNLHKALFAPTESTTYYVTSNGEIYSESFS